MLLFVCGIAAVLADESVRAVQARLKAEGFYFGQVNGEYTSETAAAVSRYQIRNGLPISGQVDADTAKALGVAVTNAPANSTAPDTWRRLRKTDRQFLQKLNRAEPNRAPAKAEDAKPLQPVDADGSTFVLSRERLRDYVAGFVLAGLDPQVDSELGFFADRVAYFGDGLMPREKIRGDLQRYDRKWPQRRFWLAGEVNVEPQPDSRIRVTFPLRFELHNGSKHSSGKVMKTLLLEVVGDDLQIVGVNERKG